MTAKKAAKPKTVTPNELTEFAWFVGKSMSRMVTDSSWAHLNNQMGLATGIRDVLAKDSTAAPWTIKLCEAIGAGIQFELDSRDEKEAAEAAAALVGDDEEGTQH